jgi:hypothetical protein
MESTAWTNSTEEAHWSGAPPFFAVSIMSRAFFRLEAKGRSMNMGMPASR